MHVVSGSALTMCNDRRSLVLAVIVLLIEIMLLFSLALRIYPPRSSVAPIAVFNVLAVIGSVFGLIHLVVLVLKSRRFGFVDLFTLVTHVFNMCLNLIGCGIVFLGWGWEV
jgi:hypothetical protein